MIGERWAEHFQVVRLLGEGREGTVYQARDVRSGQDVALKLLRRLPDHARQFEGAALREARHPHLVTIFEVGRQDGAAYLVQELFPQGTLRDHRLPLSHEALFALAQQMLAALGFLHGLGMLHGDVKPENIFVTGTEPWAFKLGDYGLARRSVDVSQGITRGTPAFMPPEVIRGEPDDERSDFYALGITLYECAFGELPFAAAELRDLFAQHLHEAPPRLAQPGDLPGSLLRLLRALLGKEPAVRPRTAVAAQSLLAGEPTKGLHWVPERLGVLVGREPERRRLLEALRNDPVCMSLEGPEGIGKSRLLREFGLEAQLQGTAVWSWDDLGLHGPGGDHEIDAARAQEPSALAASWAQQVETALGAGPWLLVVDHLDIRPLWFRDSLAVLLRGVATQPRAGCLVCVAGRQDVSTFVDTALSRAGLPGAPVEALQPWDVVGVQQAAAAMLGIADIDDTIVDFLVQSTGGVPAGVESVIRQLVAANGLRASADGRVTLGLAVHPEMFTGDWLHTALDGLDPPHLEVLRTLVGLRSLVSELHLHALLEEEGGSRLRHLRAIGLVRSVTRGDRVLYRTAHEGVYQATLERMTAAERARIHDRIADFLDRDPEALPEEDPTWHRCLGSDLLRGHQAYESLRKSLAGNHPERLLQAGTALLELWPHGSEGSRREGLEVDVLRTRQHLGEFEEVARRSADILQTVHDPEHQQQIRNLWSDALYALSRTEESLQVLGDPHGGRAGQEGVLRQAVVLTQLGRFDEAHHLCDELEAVLSADDPLRVSLVDAKVAILREQEDLESAVSVLRAALDAASRSVIPVPLGRLWMRLGQVEFGRGRMREARECFEVALREADGNANPFHKARILTGLGAIGAESGDFESAQETFLEALHLCQRLGDSVNATNILGNTGQMQAVLGLYGKALANTTRCLSWASQWMLQGIHIRIRIIRAGVLAKLGARDEVEAEVREILGSTDSERYRGQALAVRAELESQLGEQGVDDSGLEEILTLFERNAIEDEALRVQLLVARRDARCGEADVALQRTETVARGAARLQLPELLVEAELFRSELLSDRDASVARERAQRSLELARHYGFRESMWRGEALLARIGEPQDASIRCAHYQACLDLFREMTEGLPARLTAGFLALPGPRQILDDLVLLSPRPAGAPLRSRTR